MERAADGSVAPLSCKVFLLLFVHKKKTSFGLLSRYRPPVRGPAVPAGHEREPPPRGAGVSHQLEAERLGDGGADREQDRAAGGAASDPAGVEMHRP